LGFVALKTGRELADGGTTVRKSVWQIVGCIGLFMLFGAVSVSAQTPLGTEFTYQGSLALSGSPVNGTADFQFKLFGALSGGSQIGSTVSVNNVALAEGVFTVPLDFGTSAFTGDKRWLEITVRSPAGSGAFVLLSPRQPLTAAPYALKTRGVDGHSLDASDGSPTDALSIDATGNVGIGTTTPSKSLHVRAEEPALILEDPGSPSTQWGYVDFRNGTTSMAWAGFGTEGSPHFSVVNARSGGDIVLTPLGGGNVRAGELTVLSDGRVGIGTTTPGRTLSLRADTPSLSIEDPGSPGTQTGYISYLNGTGETAWVGYGTAGSADFSVVNARAGGNIMLTPLGGGVVKVPVLEITGADIAERFPSSDKVEPGMVVALDADNRGHVCLARGAYNRRVAGVVSGANGFSVGAVLGNLPGHEDAPPIALSGRVYVYCDATHGAIEVGDLLTTSETPGHAMKVIDGERSQGAILGKAMESLSEGRGLVLVLVSLQ
jgi:hypothetical protein